ncbi:3'-5' exoribonuclease YhaM family protein [Candidatus Latescibacterota bacterium]
MNENCTISEMNDGDEFVGFYVLKRCELKEFNGGFRVDVELSDSTGTLPGVIWDDAHEYVKTLSKGIVVKVKGHVGSYRDRLQVRIEKIRPAEEGEYVSESFIPSTSKDVNELIERLNSLVDSIEDTYLSRLGKLIFGNSQLLQEFSKSPGGMKWHHPYLGGLLEHSVGVTEMCDFVAQQHPELNRDLLVLAALLHDIGKIKEFSATTVIDYTDEGRLEGHIVIGERFVRNMCDRIENFPSKLKMLISHLMLSHQGHKEFSSPVEPMIPEGFVIYYADEIDSKLNALEKIITKTTDEEKKWSTFNRILSRFIYADRDEVGEETQE